MNFKKILVGVDFSNASTRALQRAAALARGSSAELHVIHVIPGLYYRGAPYVEPLTPDAQNRERSEAEKALSEAVASLSSELSPVHAEVLEGEPRDTILNYANTIEADLIVVASTGHGRLHEILLGSVAGHISHAATCSVLIVKN